MKRKSGFSNTLIAAMAIITLSFAACSSPEKEREKPNPVEANIKAYAHVWDEIMNKGKLDMFNDSNFTKDFLKLKF